MTLATPTMITNGYDTDNQDPYVTTDTVTGAGIPWTGVLTAGRLYVLVLHHYRTAATTLNAVTHDAGGTPLSFARVTDGSVSAQVVSWDAAGHRTAEVWYVIPAADTANAGITMDWNATGSASGWTLIEYASGFDSTTPFRQVVVASGTAGTTASVTMAAFGASGNGTLFCAFNGTGTGAPGEAFAATEGRTELAENDESERADHCVHHQTPNGSDTTLNATWTNAEDWAAIGIEIVASTGGGGISVTPAFAEASALAQFGALVLGSISIPNKIAEASATALIGTIRHGNILLTPALAEASALAPDPSVAIGGGGLAITPALAEGSATASLGAVKLGSHSFAPARAEASALAQYLKVIQGGLTLIPARAEASALALLGNVRQGAISLTPARAEASALALLGNIRLGGLSITPGRAEASALALIGLIRHGSILLTPGLAEASAVAPNPTVFLSGGGLAFTPAQAEASATALLGVVKLGSHSMTPAFAAAKAAALVANIRLGGLAIHPAWAEASALALGPTVRQGNLLLVPALAQARALGFVGTIRLSGLTIVPVLAEASAVAPNPTVTVFGGILIQPPAAIARALALDPTVVVVMLLLGVDYWNDAAQRIFGVLDHADIEFDHE